MSLLEDRSVAMIPTGLLSGAGSLVSGLAKGIGSVASKLLPYANLGLTAYGAYSATKSVAKAAMPGGAPIYGGGGYNMLTGGSSGSIWPFTPGNPYGGIGEPGGIFGGSTQVVPNYSRGGPRLPRQIMVPSPSNPAVQRTYVLAPMVRYRVSVSRAGRRRCSGGR